LRRRNPRHISGERVLLVSLELRHLRRRVRNLSYLEPGRDQLEAICLRRIISEDVSRDRLLGYEIKYAMV
jgi:hypothetical protein